jgi:hypothetical protein
LFLDIYTSYRPNKLAKVVEKYFGSSAGQGSLSPVQIADFYGQVHGFLSEEAQAVAGLFGKDAAPGLLCTLQDKIMHPLLEPMKARYTAADYAVVEEFSRRVAPLLVGAAEEDLVRTFRVTYGSFLSSSDILIGSEGSLLQKDLKQALAGVRFDTRVAPSAGFSVLDDDSSCGEVDLSMFDSDDISAVFEKYGESLGMAIDNTKVCIAESIMRSVGFMGGLRARKYVRFLSPVMSQHMKSLLLCIEELRVAGSMPSCDGGESTTASSSGGAAVDASGRASEDQYATASRLAKELRMGEIGLSKGKTLLPCALRVFRSAGAMCRHFTALELLATDQLGKAYENLFAENRAGLGQVVRQVGFDRSAGRDDVSVSIGGALAAAVLTEDGHAQAELRAFLTALTRRTSTSVTQSVFSSSLGTLAKFKQSAEKFLFDLTILVPEVYLRDLHGDEQWVAEGRVSPDQEDSMLPQQAFTQVGEHLLSLLQELETFASDCDLADLLQLGGDAEGLAVSSWKRLRDILKLKDVRSDCFCFVCTELYCCDSLF